MIAVDLITDVASPSGYSAHGREVIKALHPYVDLRIIDHKCNRLSVDLTPEENELFAVLQSKTRDPQVRIQFETPEWFDPQNSMVNIGFTQWETTRIPDEDIQGNPRYNWVKQMNRMDEMWSSCSLGIRAFQDSGVTIPGHVVQGPMDTQLYRPGHEELPLEGIVFKEDKYVSRSERPVVVAMMAQWQERKNVEAFLYTMLSRFKKGEIVILLKAYGSTMDDAQGTIVEERVNQVRGWVGNPNAPDVVVITQKLTDLEIARFFNSVDIYVNTSRGEGFCMPLVQAMATECFPVSCGFSAPADYIKSPHEPAFAEELGAALKHQAEDVNGFLVNYTLEPVMGVKGSAWYTYKQDWATIDCDDLQKKVHVARNLRETKHSHWDTVRQNARKYVQEHMSHEVIGKHMAKLIEGACERSNKLVSPGL